MTAPLNDALWQTELPGFLPPRRGKVRDLYDLGDVLLLVASDRLSAYDHILRPAIPGKGKILTQLSSFWFRRLSHLAEHHLLATAPEEFPAPLGAHRELLRGRAVLVRRTEVVPFECVARGYLAGSAFREYRAGGSVCGVALPLGLERASRLPEPVFTPATKAASGHDENVDFDALVLGVGGATAERLRERTLRLYRAAAAHAESCGLILADTKFEFGWLHGDGAEPELLWIDEALTPDSSRYWEAASWRPGSEPASFDKQFVRNWLDESGWDHESPPPRLPAEVVEGTFARYAEAFRRLTGAAPEI